MAKKTEIKPELERIYVIPLLKEWSKVPRYKRAKKAIRGIREFIVRHMKIRSRDLTKVRIDKFLNEEIWFRGIKKPPHKIKVKAIKEGDIVRVELVDFKDKLKFKKAREEKIIQTSEEKKKEKLAKKAVAEETSPEVEKGEEGKSEKEEKAKASEAATRITETQHKAPKYKTNTKIKQPKHQFRKALEK
jgi:large subunit ribosomal protein L31e